MFIESGDSFHTSTYSDSLPYKLRRHESATAVLAKINNDADIKKTFEENLYILMY